MGAGKSTFLGGALLAISLATGWPAAAMEPAQPGAATPSLPVISLPAFLDDARVPDMQEAWRLHGSAPEAPAPQQGTTATISDEEALAAARAAMIRAEQAGREAAAVRQKAEELSRRFGNESPAAAPADAGAVSTSSIDPSAAAASEAPASAGETPEASVPAAPDPAATQPQAAPAAETAAKTQDEGTDKQPAAAAKGASVPPSPVRSPKATVSDARPNPPSSTGTPPAKPGPGPAGKADAIPAYMGAFGWDSQPE